MKQIITVLSRFAAAAALISKLLMSVTACAGGQKSERIINPSEKKLSAEETRKMVEAARAEFYQNETLKEELSSEIIKKKEKIETEEAGDVTGEFYVLTHNEKSMRFFMEKIGEPDSNGKYPLYITLHGGGGGPAGGNNEQWMGMFDYYKGAVKSGIYIACRGITDTWDLHFQDDSYPLYDRLIEAMVVNYDADPDRVYLLGFSAGGDGVYQVTPRLADRFAAANMSSGHPNGVLLLNLANCPICLQTGIRDYYAADVMRVTRTAEFEKTLSEYREKYGFGYEHKVFVHVPAGHNFNDNFSGMSLVLKDPAGYAELESSEKLLDRYLDVLEETMNTRDVTILSYNDVGANPAFDDKFMKILTDTLKLEMVEEDTNAVSYVSAFTRKPAPEKIVWDLSTRASKREKTGFYWLEAEAAVDQGVITASYDADTNTISVEPDEKVNGDFTILFHPDLVDVSKPITIKTPEITRTVQVNPSEEFLKSSMLENGDPELGFIGKIRYSELVP